MRRRAVTSLYAGLLFTVLGVIAWASGQPFVFPSLGPTAFVLAFELHSDRIGSARIVGSHLIGGLAGLLAWSLLGGRMAITATPLPLSLRGWDSQRVRRYRSYSPAGR